MDDMERAAACKIIDTFRDAPELKLDTSQFVSDDELEKIEEPEKKNPKKT